MTLELRAWSATLVVLDAAEQRRCQQLLAAAAGRSERLGMGRGMMTNAFEEGLGYLWIDCQKVFGEAGQGDTTL